jgi:outer membrane lipoprotein LolB
VTRARIRSLALPACAALLAACAALPPPTAPEAPIVAADSPFDIGGRLSARRGDDGVAGNFSWTHDPPHDAIALATPLGQTLARLEGNGRDVSVELSDGRIEHAPDFAALTEKAFGVTIPVAGLAFWIRALPQPRVRYDVERDDAGRIGVLRQDGWETVYTYADAAAREPSRVTLRYPGADPIEVRVVVDRRQ